MSYTRIDSASREEWLAERGKGIGSSEVATIMGLNPYETPFELWRRKKGLAPAKEETPAMRMGHVLEPQVAQLFAEATGKVIDPSSAGDWIAVCDVNPALRVSPDRLYYLSGAEGARGILECKSTRKSVDAESVPPMWFAQLQYQMGVCEIEEGSLAWLVSGLDFGHATYSFNPAFFKAMREKVEEFTERYIRGDERPAPVSAADCAAMFPRHAEGKELTADERVMDAIDKLRHVKEAIAAHEERKEGLEAIIKAAFGDAERLTDPYGNTLATFKAAKDSRKFDAKTFAADHAALYEEYLKPLPGSRRLLIK